MEVLLLGTAAAEGWPCPWCTCDACAEARRRGGRDIRTRAGALIDGVVKVDLGPDTMMQMQRAGRVLDQVTTLIFTHGHDDHFRPGGLQYRGPHFVTRAPLSTMQIYASAEVCEKLHGQYDDFEPLHIELCPPLEPLRPVTTSDGTEILPLPALHSPEALLLRITRQDRSVFYGHDSGLYPEETINALAGQPLGLALFDCTYGPSSSDYEGHMGIDGVLAMVEKLRGVGAVTEETVLVATHFSHNGGIPYDDLVAQCAPHGVRVAYDGMILDID